MTGFIVLMAFTFVGGVTVALFSLQDSHGVLNGVRARMHSRGW